MKNETVELITEKKEEILNHWVEAQLNGNVHREDLADKEDLLRESNLFLEEFINVLSPGNFDVTSKEFIPLRKMIVEITQKRTLLGYTAKESALFIFSLKNSLMFFLKSIYDKKPTLLLTELKTLNELIDELGTITFDTFIADREEIIRRQRKELLEASTPIIKLWDGILGVPIIGTVDSQRSQQIMDKLLNAINDTGYSIAIIDISGVSTLDTLTAQHILKTSAAARLMGATCIISGISPAIAQTIISLDIDLGVTKTKGTMSEAIQMALQIINKKKEHKLELKYGQDSNTEAGKSIVNHHSK
ncbi:STAS domain-containing protein [Flexithrix dorotheae]|uniref:STAS domain-containing protein n=1 Tax=Flexithrix dorotheae TaxID=70993 RepID=UPI00036FBFE9|nr:STAS domain-containing protein [Flexithrix dorotheae]